MPLPRSQIISPVSFPGFSPPCTGRSIRHPRNSRKCPTACGWASILPDFCWHRNPSGRLPPLLPVPKKCRLSCALGVRWRFYCHRVVSTLRHPALPTVRTVWEVVSGMQCPSRWRDADMPPGNKCDEIFSVFFRWSGVCSTISQKKDYVLLEPAFWYICTCTCYLICRYFASRQHTTISTSEKEKNGIR